MQSDLLDVIGKILTFSVILHLPYYFRFTLTRILCPEFPGERFESFNLCELVCVRKRTIFTGRN